MYKPKCCFKISFYVALSNTNIPIQGQSNVKETHLGSRRGQLGRAIVDRVHGNVRRTIFGRPHRVLWHDYEEERENHRSPQTVHIDASSGRADHTQRGWRLAFRGRVHHVFGRWYLTKGGEPGKAPCLHGRHCVARTAWKETHLRGGRR